MKKSFMLISALAFLLALNACGGKTSSNSQSSIKSEPDSSSTSSISSSTPASSNAASSSTNSSGKASSSSSRQASSSNAASSSQAASSSSNKPASSSSQAASSSSSKPTSSSSQAASSSSNKPASSSNAASSSQAASSSSSEKPVVASTFRVVGSFNDWDYSKGVTFVDATDTSEVTKGTYVNRYKAQFDIGPQKLFKVRNDADLWIGGDKMVANDYFDNIPEDNNNILSYYKGSVTLYLSVLVNNDYRINIDFAKEPSTMVDVTFSITKEAPAGKSVYLIGSFCNWSAADEDAIRFNKGENNVWSAKFQMITNEYIECKFVLAATENPGEPEWEGGNNRVFLLLGPLTKTFTWQD